MTSASAFAKGSQRKVFSSFGVFTCRFNLRMCRDISICVWRSAFTESVIYCRFVINHLPTTVISAGSRPWEKLGARSSSGGRWSPKKIWASVWSKNKGGGGGGGALVINLSLLEFNIKTYSWLITVMIFTWWEARSKPTLWLSTSTD